MCYKRYVMLPVVSLLKGLVMGKRFHLMTSPSWSMKTLVGFRINASLIFVSDYDQSGMTSLFRRLSIIVPAFCCGKSGRNKHHSLIPDNGNCKIAICSEAEQGGDIFKNDVSSSYIVESSTVQYILVSFNVMTQGTLHSWGHRMSYCSRRE